MKLRLFVAVEVDDQVRRLASSAAAALAAAGIAGRFEPLEKLHVTIAFLGSTQDAMLQAVTQALHEASAACRPFELDFSRIGAFPNERRARVIWIGPAQESAAFVQCARRVRDAYEGLGFTFDHDATPHVSICRPARGAHAELPELTGSATVSVAGFTLFQSLPAGQTTRYEALERTRFPR
jgi:RNA 2',3'-cyclic 3'-phosphodiesterase